LKKYINIPKKNMVYWWK